MVPIDLENIFLYYNSVNIILIDFEDIEED
jgi:hypothetical protein